MNTGRHQRNKEKLEAIRARRRQRGALSVRSVNTEEEPASPIKAAPEPVTPETPEPVTQPVMQELVATDPASTVNEAPVALPNTPRSNGFDAPCLLPEEVAAVLQSSIPHSPNVSDAPCLEPEEVAAVLQRPPHPHISEPEESEEPEIEQPHAHTEVTVLTSAADTGHALSQRLEPVPEESSTTTATTMEAPAVVQEPAIHGTAPVTQHQAVPVNSTVQVTQEQTLSAQPEPQAQEVDKPESPASNIANRMKEVQRKKVEQEKARRELDAAMEVSNEVVEESFESQGTQGTHATSDPDLSNVDREIEDVLSRSTCPEDADDDTIESARREARKAKKKVGRKQKKVRIKDNDDDSVSLDSRVDVYLSMERSDAVTHALDHVMDYFGPLVDDDLRSLDEESWRSEESEQQPSLFGSFFPASSTKNKTDIFRDIEELVMERLTCGVQGAPTPDGRNDQDSATAESSVGGSDTFELKVGRKLKSASATKQKKPTEAKNPKKSGSVYQEGLALFNEFFEAPKPMRRRSKNDDKQKADATNEPDEQAGEAKRTRSDNSAHSELSDLLGGAPGGENVTEPQDSEGVGRESEEDKDGDATGSDIGAQGMSSPDAAGQAAPSQVKGQAHDDIPDDEQSAATRSIVMPSTATTNDKVDTLPPKSDSATDVYAPSQQLEESTSWFSADEESEKTKSKDDELKPDEPKGNAPAAEESKEATTLADFQKTVEKLQKKHWDAVQSSKIMQGLQHVLKDFDLTSLERESITERVKVALGGQAKDAKPSNPEPTISVPKLEIIDEVHDEPIEQSLDEMVCLLNSSTELDTAIAGELSQQEAERPNMGRDRADVDEHESSGTEPSDSPSDERSQEQALVTVRNSPQASDASKSKKKKKKGKFGPLSILGRPLFKRNSKKVSNSNRESTASIAAHDSLQSAVEDLNKGNESDLNTSTESTVLSSALGSPERKANPEEPMSPMDPSQSTKAKREAWRTMKQDEVVKTDTKPVNLKEFDVIMTSNARDDDWGTMEDPVLATADTVSQTSISEILAEEETPTTAHPSDTVSQTSISVVLAEETPTTAHPSANNVSVAAADAPEEKRTEPEDLAIADLVTNSTAVSKLADTETSEPNVYSAAADEWFSPQVDEWEQVGVSTTSIAGSAQEIRLKVSF